MNKRIEKRFKRENRKNKGVNTEAKRQVHNDRIRASRDMMGGMDPFGGNEALMLMAASMFGRKR